MQICTFGSKSFDKSNKIKQNNEQKQSIKHSNYDCLPHCYMDKNLLNISFKGDISQGPKTEINLFELREDFAELYVKIKNTKSSDAKIKLFEATTNLIKSFLHNWSDMNQSYLNETEREMFGDFTHELSNDYNYPYLEYIVLGHMQQKENISSIDDISKDMLKDLYKTTKRYKFFIERGLSAQSKNLPEMMKLVLKPEKEHFKKRNIKLKIEGKELLKNESIKFKLTDYETYIVLRNITQNASKYSFDNSTIKLKLDLDRENSLLKVSVEDEGIGIKDKEKVREGQRDENAIKSGVSGTGKGLRRVINILKKVGQELIIEDGKEKGTIMKFSIPVAIKV